MLLLPDERTAFFVDGQNLYAAQKALGLDTDYAALLSYFRTHCMMVSARYYTSYPDDKDFVTIRPLLDWLAFNGYIVSARPRRVGSSGRTDARGRSTSLVDLAVDALLLAPHLKHIVLFSGDEVLLPLVAALKAEGKRVTVASTLKVNPPVCSRELADRADAFVDLDSFLRELSADSQATRPKGK